MHTRKSFQLSAYIEYHSRKSFQFTAAVTSQRWQLASYSFLEYSSAMRQTWQILYSAKKTRQVVAAKF